VQEIDTLDLIYRLSGKFPLIERKLFIAFVLSSGNY
jgi:hypothetical protein